MTTQKSAASAPEETKNAGTTPGGSADKSAPAFAPADKSASAEAHAGKVGISPPAPLADEPSPAAPGHVSEDLRKLLESTRLPEDDAPNSDSSTTGDPIAANAPAGAKVEDGAEDGAEDVAPDGDAPAVAADSPTEDEGGEHPEEELDEDDLQDEPVRKDDGNRSGVDLDLQDF